MLNTIKELWQKWQHMNIIFKNTTAKKQFSSEYKQSWRYPEKVKEKLLAAENLIQKATSLRDIANYQPFRFHQLKGDRKSEWSIYLGNTGYRITLFPCDDSGLAITSGDIIAQCKMIKIVMVTEVSNHYE